LIFLNLRLLVNQELFLTIHTLIQMLSVDDSTGIILSFSEAFDQFQKTNSKFALSLIDSVKKKPPPVKPKTIFSSPSAVPENLTDTNSAAKARAFFQGKINEQHVTTAKNGSSVENRLF